MKKKNKEENNKEKMLKVKFYLVSNNKDHIKKNIEFEQVLVSNFEGFTNCGGVSGHWKDNETNTLYKDSSTAYEIVLKESELDKLKSLLTSHKDLLGEKTLYLDYQEVQMELL